MPEDKLQKFVENMRAAGQSDVMIAESLIDAGNNKLEVLNLFGVSTIEELRAQSGEDTTETEEPTPANELKTVPLVDDEGNIVFGKTAFADEPDKEPEIGAVPAKQKYPIEESRQIGAVVQPNKPEEKVVAPIEESGNQENEDAPTEEPSDTEVPDEETESKEEATETPTAEEKAIDTTQVEDAPKSPDDEKPKSSIDEDIDKKLDEIFDATSRALPDNPLNMQPVEETLAPKDKQEDGTSEQERPQTPAARTVAPHATNLHRFGSQTKPRSVMREKPSPEEAKSEDEPAQLDPAQSVIEETMPSETPTAEQITDENVHEHHHSPHSFQETMEDLTSHEELEATDTSSEEEKPDGVIELPIVPEKKVAESDTLGLEPEASTEKEEPIPSDIPKHVTPTEPVIPFHAATDMDDVADMLPSLGNEAEITPEQLVAEKTNEDEHDTDSTEEDAKARAELQAIGEETAKEIEEEEKAEPNTPIDEKAAMTQAHEKSDIAEVGQKAKAIQNNLWIKVVVILLVVGLIVGAAIGLMVKIKNNAPSVEATNSQLEQT